MIWAIKSKVVKYIKSPMTMATFDEKMELHAEIDVFYSETKQESPRGASLKHGHQYDSNVSSEGEVGTYKSPDRNNSEFIGIATPEKQTVDLLWSASDTKRSCRRSPRFSPWLSSTPRTANMTVNQWREQRATHQAKTDKKVKLGNKKNKSKSARKLF